MGWIGFINRDPKTWINATFPIKSTAVIQYSLAICPIEIRAAVLEISMALKTVTGPFEREGTEPHATINVFTPHSLNAWMRHLKEKLSFAEPFEVYFNKIGISPNGPQGKYIVVLLPDEQSGVLLKTLMKSVNKNSPKAFHKTQNPHITIAYGLTPEQGEKAREYLSGKKFEIRFTVDNLALRERKLGPFEHFQVRQRFYFKDPADTLLF